MSGDDQFVHLRGRSAYSLLESMLHVKALGALAKALPWRLYVELQRHNEPGEAAIEAALIDAAYTLALPLVATNDVRFAERGDHHAHDALTCIAASSYLGEEERPRLSEEHYFK